MALPSDTLTSFAAIGNREDLSDIIYDISPAETPFLSAIPKGKAITVGLRISLLNVNHFYNHVLMGTFASSTKFLYTPG